MAALKKHRKLCLFLFTGMLCRYLLHICVQVSKCFTDFGGATWCQTPTYCIGSGPLPGLAFAENSREQLENSGWGKEEKHIDLLKSLLQMHCHIFEWSMPCFAFSLNINYIYTAKIRFCPASQIVVYHLGWCCSPFTFWEHAWPIFEGNRTTTHWEEFCSQFASA